MRHASNKEVQAAFTQWGALLHNLGYRQVERLEGIARGFWLKPGKDGFVIESTESICVYGVGDATERALAENYVAPLESAELRYKGKPLRATLFDTDLLYETLSDAKRVRRR